MLPVVIYTTKICPYCVRAKQLLQNKGVSFDEVRVDLDPEQMQLMMERSGRRTVPQIWIGGTHVGGSDDLYALERAGKLDGMLNNEH